MKKYYIRRTLYTINEESVQLSDETDYQSSSFAIENSFLFDNNRRNKSQERIRK